MSRLHEIKRLSKALAAYYATLGHAHEAHGKTLTTLAQGETIRLPWLEQSLFLPPVGANPGEGGWAELVGQLKDGTGKEGTCFPFAVLCSSELTSLSPRPCSRGSPRVGAHHSDRDRRALETPGKIPDQGRRAATVPVEIGKYPLCVLTSQCCRRAASHDQEFYCRPRETRESACN